MKAKRLKTLGFALLGGLALLFAGCGQQPAGGNGSGAVTSVGIQLPPPGPNGYGGTVNVDVTVNEGAQVKSIVLKVDGQQVNQINVTGLRPQALTYTLLLDTAQLDPATNQPRFRNGPHTLTVEVTDVNNNTRSASSTVTFFNQDRVRGLVVSQADNPKAPVTVSGVKWYGNGNVLVTVDIVNYSGATYTLSGTGFPFDLVASGGSGGSLSGYKVQNPSSGGFSSPPTATPVSGQPQLELRKANNSSFEGSGKLEVIDNASNVVASATFGLDNVGPSSGSLDVEVRRILRDYDFISLPLSSLKGNSATLFRGTGADDTGGVGGVTYTVRFKDGLGATAATVSLPDDPSAGVTVSGLSNAVTYTVEITELLDALGNKTTLDPVVIAGSFQLADATINLSLSNISNTSPNAGGSFDVYANVSGGVGSITLGVALNLGGKLVEIANSPSSPVSATAYFGAQYVLYAVDEAGNFAVVNLPVNVQQPASDKTAPSLTVSLPSSASEGSSFSVTGTYNDANPPALGPSVDIYPSNGSLGGYEWYFSPTTAPVSGTNYSTSLVAPNYVGTLGVVVLAWDDPHNLASAAGTVNVQ